MRRLAVESGIGSWEVGPARLWEGGHGGRGRGGHETCGAGERTGRNAAALGGLEEEGSSAARALGASAGWRTVVRAEGWFAAVPTAFRSGTAEEQCRLVKLVNIMLITETCCAAYLMITATAGRLSSILCTQYPYTHCRGHFNASHGRYANRAHRKVLSICSTTAVPGMRGTYCRRYDVGSTCLILHCSISIATHDH